MIEQAIENAIEQVCQLLGVRRADLCFVARPSLIHALRKERIVIPLPIYPLDLIPEYALGDGWFASDMHITYRRDARFYYRSIMRRKLWQMVTSGRP